MKRRRNKYKVFQDACEGKNEKYRLALENEIKPTIKQLALSVGVDMEMTQHSCYVTDKRYNEVERDKFTQQVDIKFQPFQDMVYFISDELKIDVYFHIQNGKFEWW